MTVICKVKRIETQRAEMSPDLYAGASCDKVKPRWSCHADGDMGGDDYENVLRIDARSFPPGTLISIQEPLCPECDELREPSMPLGAKHPIYAPLCRCGFNWDTWRDEQYS